MHKKINIDYKMRIFEFFLPEISADQMFQINNLKTTFEIQIKQKRAKRIFWLFKK